VRSSSECYVIGVSVALGLQVVLVVGGCPYHLMTMADRPAPEPPPPPGPPPPGLGHPETRGGLGIL